MKAPSAGSEPHPTLPGQLQPLRTGWGEHSLPHLFPPGQEGRMGGAVSRGPTGQAGKARLTAGPHFPKRPASCRQDVRISLPLSKPSDGSDRHPDSQPGALHAGSQRFCFGAPSPAPGAQGRSGDSLIRPLSPLWPWWGALSCATCAAAWDGCRGLPQCISPPLPGAPLRLNPAPSHLPQPSPPVSGSVCLLTPPGLSHSLYLPPNPSTLSLCGHLSLCLCPS